jgi:cation transport ATPase
MGIAEWMRVIDTVGGLAQMTGKLRPRANPDAGLSPAGEPGGLEARLAGVVVAALKEAFDRDRARMDLERAQLESERKRADEALAAELRRQAAEQALWQLRIVAIMAITGWMLSAALAAWLPGMRGFLPRSLLGAGWLLAFGALGCAFAGAQAISAEAAALQRGGAAKAAPWLLLAALAAIAASLLAAL